MSTPVVLPSTSIVQHPIASLNCLPEGIRPEHVNLEFLGRLQRVAQAVEFFFSSPDVHVSVHEERQRILHVEAMKARIEEGKRVFLEFLECIGTNPFLEDGGDVLLQKTAVEIQSLDENSIDTEAKYNEIFGRLTFFHDCFYEMRQLLVRREELLPFLDELLLLIPPDDEALLARHHVCVVAGDCIPTLSRTPLLGWKEILERFPESIEAFCTMYGSQLLPRLRIRFSKLDPRDQAENSSLQNVVHVLKDSLDTLSRAELDTICYAYVRRKVIFLFSGARTSEILINPDFTRTRIEKRIVPLKNGTCLGSGTSKYVEKVAVLSSKGIVKEKALAKLLFSRKETVQELTWECRISQFFISKKVPYVIKNKLVRYVDSLQKEEQINIGALSEICTEGSLHDFLRIQRPERVKMLLALQLFLSMEAMHNLGYCHLDLKTTNLFVTNVRGQFELRVADLGTVCPVGKKSRHCSSYPSPEMHLHDGDIEVSVPMDLWAIGEILLALKNNRTHLFENHLAYTTSKEGFLSKATRALEDLREKMGPNPTPYDLFIMRCFDINPEGRPSAAEGRAMVQECLAAIQ